MEETRQKTTKIENSRRENNIMADTNVNILQEVSIRLNEGEKHCAFKMQTDMDTILMNIIIREVEYLNGDITVYTDNGEFIFDDKTSSWKIVEEDGFEVYRVSVSNGNEYSFCII